MYFNVPGILLCNTVLQLGSRKSGKDVSEKRSDNTEEESQYDLNQKVVANRDILKFTDNRRQRTCAM